MTATTMSTVVVILLLSTLLNHYGCNADTDECKTTIKVSRVESNTFQYKCGWFGWWMCVGRRYYIAYTNLEICCRGYEKVDGRCIKEETFTTVPQPPSSLRRMVRVASLTCGKTRFGANKLIVGGTRANHGEYPWLVSLVRGSSHFCGGMIIDDHWIVTAAHCVKSWWDNNIWDWYRVRVGEYNRLVTDADELTLKIDKVIKHADYSDMTSANDIALIKTSKKIVFNEYVKPICLPGANTQLSINSDVEIAGWGVTEDDLTSASEIVQKANMKLASLSLCQRTYGSRIVNDDMLCVTDGYGDNIRSACSGDSGGPLMLRSNDVMYGVGITSFGSATGCAAGDPVVYIDVSKYINWINEKRRN
ncbi:hypothetical protein LSH36_419g00023 [Paralvinella palmiformis]|uniref:Peptidase S1 domain-containing protein n=1 Tax=Paralvinella palmiformis TaxID=53620 RepID=A0AAD9JCQ1_9ANNE|nr:hypothetical protein LSH36_419g00023 [Paralvinella palmiformis]